MAELFWSRWKFQSYSLNEKSIRKIEDQYFDIKGNYIFSKLIGSIYYPIYIGESNAVFGRVLEHLDKPDVPVWYYSDSLFIRKEDNGIIRSGIEKILIGSLNPPQNSTFRTGLADITIRYLVPDRREKNGKFH